MEFVEQNFELLSILFGASFLGIFIAAATNKVTVFRNYGDLWMTLGLIIWPLLGLLVLSFLEAGEGNDFFTESLSKTQLPFGPGTAPFT